MIQPPGTGDLVSQINDLKRQLAELSRKSPANPACRVRLNANSSLAVTDNLASGGWVVQEDPFAMFTLPATGPCYITIQLDGLYTVNYHSACSGASSGTTAAAKVMKNGTTASVSIATDATTFPGAGADGAVLDAFRLRVKLLAGDKLYWSNYVSVAANLVATNFSVPTEITVQYTSSR